MTNDTMKGMKNAILVDSGFSGFAVIGDQTLKDNAQFFDKVKYLNSPSKSTYTFGAGESQPAPNRAVLFHKSLGRIPIDVVEGNLPMLLGRTFLRTKKAVLNFEEDIMNFNGIKFPSAFQIPLSRLANGDLGTKNCATSRVFQTELDPNPLVVSDRDKPPSALVSIFSKVSENLPCGETLGGEVRGGGSGIGGELHENEDETENEKIAKPNKQSKLTKDYNQEECHDCACCDINIFTALEKASAQNDVNPDLEIEDAIVRGWLGSDEPDRYRNNDNTESSERPLPPLRDRAGNQPIISFSRASALDKLFPSPVWFLRTGLLKRIHLLRHQPAERMIRFIETCIPPKALRQAGSRPEVKRFRDAVEHYSKFVVKNCLGCILNGKKISRPIGISIVPPFKVGMLDTFVLDYRNKWYALVVCDLGTGMCWAYPIREALSSEGAPTGKSCYVTYITRYACIFGPHKQIVTDSDSIFTGKEVTQLWQQLGVEKESVAAYAHFSMGSAERMIQMFRWAIDRIRVESPPTSWTAWEIVLSTIGNQYHNENDLSGTSPSMRVGGRFTSLLRNALLDTLVTGSEDTNEYIETAEKAVEAYTQAKSDRKLRRMLSGRNPPGISDASQPPFPKGTRVAYYRESDGSGRNPKYHGPGSVVGFDPGQQQYVIKENHHTSIVDRAHVRPWPERPGLDELDDLDPNQKPPPALENDAELKLTGSHPEDREPGVHYPRADAIDGPDFRSIIKESAPESTEGLATKQNPHGEVTCGRCRNTNQKHGHIRTYGCKNFDPDDPSTWHKDLQSQYGYDSSGRKLKNAVEKSEFGKGHEEGKSVEDVIKEQKMIEADIKIKNLNSTKSRKKRQAEKRQIEISLTTQNGERVQIVTKKDLKGEIEEDLGYIARMIESVYLADENVHLTQIDEKTGTEVSSESKYLHKWEDLPQAKKDTAYRKAVEAYDKYDSWHRGKDISDEEFKRLKKQYPNIVGLDCTMVLDAKIKNGELIGKVRIAPRGFRDNSEKATWFSTSPTAAAVSVRISELIGMMNRLKSYIFDISDAFFSGELLQEDEWIYIKVPREILILQNCDPNKPWRRLKREVPGCRGASSSWFRTLRAKLLGWGWEQLTTDQALFAKRNGKNEIIGILPMHVDDGKLRATSECAKELFDNFNKEKNITLSTIEEQKMGVSVDFTGLEFLESEEGETISQNTYIRNKLQNVEVKELRKLDENTELNAADMKVYGTCVGRLIWLLPTQIKYSYEISYLSRYRAYPRVKHMRRIAKLIQAIKHDPQYVFLPRFHKNAPIKLIAVVDAGAGEEADPPLKTRDHQCIAMLMVSPLRADEDSILPGTAVKAAVVSWQACGISRVSHSSFDFEAIVAVSSMDFLFNLKELVGEVLVSVCPSFRDKLARQNWNAKLPSCELHTDSMSLVKAVRLNVVQGLSQRRRRDVSDIRECLNKNDLSVVLHIDGPTNPADVGTKPNNRTLKAWEVCAELILKGKYLPRISKNHHETFEVNAIFHENLVPQYNRCGRIFAPTGENHFVSACIGSLPPLHYSISDLRPESAPPQLPVGG